MHDPNLLQRQIRFTEPEYVIFTPKYRDYESDNAHLHVVDHPQFGGLVGFWVRKYRKERGTILSLFYT